MKETVIAGNTKRGSITVPLTSCLTGLEYSALQIKTKIVSCHTADSKPVKQEVNDIVILPPLVFPGNCFQLDLILNYQIHFEIGKMGELYVIVSLYVMKLA